MQYNDEQIISSNQIDTLNSKYTLALSQENEDLVDILSKMKSHKDNLVKNNVDGRYDEVISSVNSNINKLDKIIRENSQIISTYNESGKSPKISDLFNSNRSIKFSQNDNTSPSPVRGKTEMENIDSYAPNSNRNNTENTNDFNINNPNNSLLPRGTFDTINNDDNDNVTSPIRGDMENTNTNINKRNSPMQSNFIFNLIKKFNLNFNQKMSSKGNTLLDNKLRYHNILALNYPCNHQRHEVGCEFDILRLLLLFMATKPHSRCYHDICSITMVELENLNYLVQ